MPCNHFIVSKSELLNPPHYISRNCKWKDLIGSHPWACAIEHYNKLYPVTLKYGEGLSLTMLRRQLNVCIISTHTYIHAYIRTHIHTYTNTHVYIHTYIHTYINTYIHTYIYTYSVHTHIHKYTCIHTYIHTYINTYIHTYIYTYSVP